MYGYITQQISNNDLSKLHGDSLYVLARLIETWFGGVALEGMQELFKDSCKQVDKTTHLHCDGLGKASINSFVFQERDIGVFVREAGKDGGLKICIKSNGGD